ncbi:hypothetical protein BSR29_02475 [Boudabousia liubingyangii]|uniref:Arginine deiminase n=1 Tax=Boudabousia liubingyangii TaxID=1921764 RepID=A0A1Q5PQB8_9ACTO|nr:arginine deiminase [Boudabousia liubingyangii]OKL49828.1 hypothetical protein BSR29_02475 [Boudabousia liubingyangii]
MSFQVASEVGRLKTVIVHRPGKEFTRLSPSNKEDLLFDDVLWLNRARQEHDRFVGAMAANGVRVLHFEQLLGEALENPEGRDFILEHSFAPAFVDPEILVPFRDYASELSGADLAELLIAGVTESEYEELVGQKLPERVASRGGMVLPCLPNHLFARDASAWAYGGVSVNLMRMPARRRESINLHTLYTYHPEFAGQDFKRWDTEAFLAQPDNPEFSDLEHSIEGGDICIIGNGAVMVGVSERTGLDGVRNLARSLFNQGAAKTVIALKLPISRAFMHLDTVMTMADEGTFLAYQGLGKVPSITMRPGANGQLEETTDDGPGMYDVIAKALGLDAIKVLVNEVDPLTAERDQWNDACNLLALAPGKVLAYERNEQANAYLESQGIEVIAVPGAELGRGRGGPRCMSCPVDREAL